VVAFETSVLLTGEAATGKLGARIAGRLRPGDLVALSGELGAGKTTLARAILRALGVTEEVPSPTFTLLQSYRTEALAVYHLDLYRLSNAGELGELGIEDALTEGAVLVEWPENGLPAKLLEDALRVSIFMESERTRQFRLSGPERWRTVVKDKI
jgi:tRNA threonylcarbamoyl adenosine modification protein YjeE